MGPHLGGMWMHATLLAIALQGLGEIRDFTLIVSSLQFLI